MKQLKDEKLINFDPNYPFCFLMTGKIEERQQYMRS